MRVVVIVLALGLALVPARATAFEHPSAERELITLINAHRTSNALPSLRPADALTAIARERSQDMGTRDSFSHEIPPGGRFFEDLLDDAGIGYRRAGESIARNNRPDPESPRSAQRSFTNSPSHRANILDPYYTELGVGAWQRPVGRGHLEQVLREYVAHYNAARPHRALELRAPLAHGHLARRTRPVQEVIRRDRLGGLIHEYEPLAV